MFDTDQVRLLMKAAVEYDRHGTLPVWYTLHCPCAL